MTRDHRDDGSPLVGMFWILVIELGILAVAWWWL
jgi:hypothetical protein